jgi:hypothetical protein
MPVLHVKAKFTIVLLLVAAPEEAELLCAIVSNTVKGMIILLQARYHGFARG